MTTRLSISNFAGTERTLVAVGTERLASMLVTTRAAGPFRAVVAVVVAVVVAMAVDVVPFGLATGAAAGVATGALSGDWSLGEYPSKNSHQAGSTLSLSVTNCW